MTEKPASIARQLVPVAQIVGLTGAGMLSGLIGGASYVDMNVIMQTAPDDIAAKLWLGVYTIGKSTAPPFAVLCSLCFGFLASQSTRSAGRFPQLSLDPTSPFALYTAAALTLPCIVPYTLGIMVPTNDRLTEKAEKTKAVSPTETQQLLKKWQRMNYNRAAIVAVATVLGAAATVLSVS